MGTTDDFLRIEADALNIGNTNTESLKTDMSGLIDIMGIDYKASTAGMKFTVSPQQNASHNLEIYRGKISDTLLDKLTNIASGNEVVNSDIEMMDLLKDIYNATNLSGMSAVNDIGRIKIKIALNRLDEAFNTGRSMDGTGSLGGDEATIFQKLNHYTLEQVEKVLEDIDIDIAAIAYVFDLFDHDHGKDLYAARRGFGMGISAGILDDKTPLAEYKGARSKLELLLTEVKDEVGSRNHGFLKFKMAEVESIMNSSGISDSIKAEILDTIKDIDGSYRKADSNKDALINYEKELFSIVNEGLSVPDFSVDLVDLFDPRVEQISSAIENILNKNEEGTTELAADITSYLKNENNVSKQRVTKILTKVQEIRLGSGEQGSQGQFGIEAFKQKTSLTNYFMDLEGAVLPSNPELPKQYQDIVAADPGKPQAVAILDHILEKYADGLTSGQKQSLKALEYFTYTRDPITRTYITDNIFNNVADAFIAKHDNLGIACLGAENLNGLNKIDSSLANKYLRDISDMIQTTFKDYGIDEDNYIISHKSSKFTIVFADNDQRIDENIKAEMMNDLSEKMLEFNNKNILDYAKASNIDLNDEAMTYLDSKAPQKGKTVETMKFADVPNPKREEYGLVLPAVFSNIDKNESAASQIMGINQNIEWTIKANRDGFDDPVEFQNDFVAKFTASIIDKLKAA